MAYDAARGQVVLFGGYDGNSLNDTWVWDGTNWTQKSPASSPPARYYHAMAYDAARSQVVLFGGTGSSGRPDDTWFWDGTDWAQKSPASSPPARNSHAMAYDTARGQVVLFGGWDGNSYLSDTWVWDGTNWAQKNTMTSPSPLVHHAMAYDAARGQVVLFGGSDGDNLNDTWVWNGTNWTQKNPASSPPARNYHAMAYEVAQGQVVLFGGSDGDNLNDTWVWDGTSWTQKSPASSPPTRYYHAMVYDAARGQAVLFAGTDDFSLNETWVWDGASWTQKSPKSSPPARAFHVMAYDAARGQTILFGGCENFRCFDDTWVWDGTDWAQKSPASSPPARSGHAMAYDAARGQVVLFGGNSVGSSLNETWVWDGTNWTQKSPAGSPPARVFHAMAYDAARGQVVLFGGVDGNSSMGDTWVWDGTDWAHKSPASSPPARNSHAMAYDAARGQVVLFGGGDFGVGNLNDTWVWDGTNWTQKSPASSPPARTVPAMVYDATREQIVLFGGQGGYCCLNDTWVWNGGSIPCNFTLSQSILNVSSGLSTGFVSVTPSSQNCAWTATTHGGSWLQLTSGLSGTGMGQIGFKVAANTSAEYRSAMIAVGGAVFVVTQESAATSGTPIPLSATSQCWGGSTSYPAGPGVLLEWEAMGWPAKYEILRDHQVIAATSGNQFYNITGLTPGKTYVYQVRAVSGTTSLPSAQVVAAALTNCSTTTQLGVESITLGKALLVGGESTTENKVKLTAAAPVGGAVVTLSSSSAAVAVPANVTVVAGQAAAKFQLNTMSVQTFTVVTITATLGTSTRSVTVELKPTANSGAGVAYLLLHGINSGPDTWKDLVEDRFGHCDQLKIVNTGNFLEPYTAQHDGQIGEPWWWQKPANGCYALGFGSAGGWDNGDGLNYIELGQQVGAAVDLIVAQRNPAAIVFVGHSRGGLAARAFLQNLTMPTGYKKGLVTIGTPHLGSPLGRTKDWLDLHGYDWMDTWWLAGATAPGHIVAESLKFMFSPSTGNLAATHDANGVLDPNYNPALKHLNLQASALASNVNAAGQIISKGLNLGDKITSGCNLFNYTPCYFYHVIPIPTSLAAFLPGDKSALESYVFQNVPASWKTDSDGIVPAESQNLNSVVAIDMVVTHPLIAVPHTEETQKASDIGEVLNAVIQNSNMAVTAQPGGKLQEAVLSEQSTEGSPRGRADEQKEDADVARTRLKLLWLSEGELVEWATKGIRLNSLEGLLSRQEMRQRGGESQRELVAQIERRLQRGESEDQIHAARLLAEVSAEHSAVTLIGLVRDERDPEVRSSAMKALRSLAQDTATLDGRMLLSQELGDLAGGSLESDPAALMAAVDGLVALGAAQDVERLIDLYKRAQQGQQKLIEARMGELRNGEGARRLAAYLEADPDVLQEETRLAGEVLSEMSTVESVSGLLAWAKDLTLEPLKADAVRWLGKIRSTRGKARLAEAVNQEMFRSEELRQRLTQLLSSDSQCACAPAVKPQ